jgi:hypothetical protein
MWLGLKRLAAKTDEPRCRQAQRRCRLDSSQPLIRIRRLIWVVGARVQSAGGNSAVVLSPGGAVSPRGSGRMGCADVIFWMQNEFVAHAYSPVQQPRP